MEQINILNEDYYFLSRMPVRNNTDSAGVVSKETGPPCPQEEEERHATLISHYGHKFPTKKKKRKKDAQPSQVIIILFTMDKNSLQYKKVFPTKKHIKRKERNKEMHPSQGIIAL